MKNNNGSGPSNIIQFEHLEQWKSPEAGGDNAGDGATATHGWMTDERGKPINNLANVLLTLRTDPMLNAAIALDEMLQTVCVIKPLPGSDEPVASFGARRITDHDVTRIQEYLQHRGLLRVGKDLVHQAVDTYAQENKHHPVRDELVSLTWDGVKRLETWLSTYLGADQTPYSAGVGIMMLVSMVARIMEPGCKVDHMPILEGPQGTGKSTVCKIFGGRYFSDSLPDVNRNKDALGHLSGKWVIEVPELWAMSNAEVSRLKAFITGTEDQYRPPYGRKEVKVPRQCVFIGTTNHTAYLKDETGSRRYWPISTGTIDLEKLQKDRGQLLAEALALYNEGAKWHPTQEFEKEHIRPQQDGRFETDAWEPEIKAYLEEHKPQKVYLGQLFKDVLNMEIGARDRSKQKRMTAILTHLGWDRLPKDSKGNIPWGPPK